MVLIIGEQKWYLHFKTRVEVPKANQPEPLWQIVTECYVHTGPHIWTHKIDATTPVRCINGRSGEAKCSRKDGYSRKVGNRLALTRALEKLPVETRTQLWAAYWQRVKFPKESSAHFKQRLAAKAEAEKAEKK